MASPLLEAKALSYGTPSGKTLATNISLSLAPSEALWVRGPNGAGKTTFLRVLLGKQGILSGQLTRHISLNRVYYIPQLQNTAMHLPLTLRDVLEIGSPIRLDPDAVASFGLIEPNQLSRAWNSASGGERKRTLLTRALLSDCELIVLDEPMNHLDKASQVAICKALASCPQSLVIVSHESIEQITSIKKTRELHLGNG